jgi:hypothetical protein
MRINKIAALGITIALTITSCDSDGCNPEQPCDENGAPLIFVPYWYPGGPLGAAHWIEPNQPNYRPTFQNKPPGYTPPGKVQLPAVGKPVPPPAAPRSGFGSSITRGGFGSSGAGRTGSGSVGS